MRERDLRRDDLQSIYARHGPTRARQDLKKKDFTVKKESISRKRRGKREYLNDAETRSMIRSYMGISILRSIFL